MRPRRRTRDGCAQGSPSGAAPRAQPTACHGLAVPRAGGLRPHGACARPMHAAQQTSPREHTEVRGLFVPPPPETHHRHVLVPLRQRPDDLHLRLQVVCGRRGRGEAWGGREGGERAEDTLHPSRARRQLCLRARRAHAPAQTSRISISFPLTENCSRPDMAPAVCQAGATEGGVSGLSCPRGGWKVDFLSLSLSKEGALSSDLGAALRAAVHTCTALGGRMGWGGGGADDEARARLL
jgi:hypothetical protein